MEIRVPHQITYDVPAAVTVAEVVESLLGAEALLREIAPLLEGCIPGLHVEKIDVSVRSISQESPLKEIFWGALFLTFQKDLEADVPKIIEDLFGVQVPDHYDTIVTLAFCLLLFYGADFLYHQIHKVAQSFRIRKQLDSLISEISRDCSIPEEKIKTLLEDRYSKKRIKSIANASVRVFLPSKNQMNAPLLIGNRHIERETVAEFPGEARIVELEEEETSRQLQGVEIELHAQDIDRSKQGWAAVIPSVTKRRLRMELYPPIKPEQIYTRPKVKGDVVVVSRRTPQGTMEPYMFHLLRVVD